MMTPPNGNIFRVTGPLRWDSIGHRRIPLTKASDTELRYLLWCAPEQTVEQTVEMPVIWDTIGHCNAKKMFSTVMKGVNVIYIV